MKVKSIKKFVTYRRFRVLMQHKSDFIDINIILYCHFAALPSTPTDKYFLKYLPWWICNSNILSQRYINVKKLHLFESRILHKAIAKYVYDSTYVTICTILSIICNNFQEHCLFYSTAVLVDFAYIKTSSVYLFNSRWLFK